MILLIDYVCVFKGISTFGPQKNQKKMKFVGFVITIIVASSAFFTLLAISVGAVTLMKKDKEEDEPIALD